MNKYLPFYVLIFLIGCNPIDENKREQPLEIDLTETPELTIDQANRLAQLPLACMMVEYPNKLNQVIGSDSDLQSPKELHPAFYGCFDWHSSVHGHWSLVSLLKRYPNLDSADVVRDKLASNMSEENILEEVAYFEKNINRTFERTYGWAWLLKLAEELYTWDDPLGKSLYNNLSPLTNLIANNYLEFLPKLNYPIRVGEHTNTAFGLSFAYDYAVTVQNDSLAKLISSRARDFYLNDSGCPISWEPSGFDFLSPCLQEVDIMRKVLSEREFKTWITSFLPALEASGFSWEPGQVSDRSDGKLVHLDGVNFSRAWCLYGLARQYPEFSHLTNSANKHLSYSLESIFDENYEGTHWLGSFAIYALNCANE